MLPRREEPTLCIFLAAASDEAQQTGTFSHTSWMRQLRKALRFLIRLLSVVASSTCCWTKVGCTQASSNGGCSVDGWPACETLAATKLQNTGPITFPILVQKFGKPKAAPGPIRPRHCKFGGQNGNGYKQTNASPKIEGFSSCPIVQVQKGSTLRVPVRQGGGIFPLLNHFSLPWTSKFITYFLWQSGC